MKITIENTICRNRKEPLDEINQLLNLAVEHKTVKSFMEAVEKMNLQFLKVGNGGSHVWVKEVLFDQVTGERIIMFTEEECKKPETPVAQEEVDTCVLCGAPDRDKRSDHLRTCYKISQDKLEKGMFRPRLTYDEMGTLQTGTNTICSNRRKCAARQMAKRINEKKDIIYVHENGGTKVLTRKQFNKLPDCEVQKSDLVSWGGGYKFFRRSKGWVTVLIRVNENDKKDEYLTVSYKCNKVRIDGTVLPYISKYKFTNGKQPFPKQQ